MKMIYQVDDKPAFSKVIVFAIQQLLAIMAATLVVPLNVTADVNKLGLDVKLLGADAMSPAAALFGAGIGTLVYILFTKRKSPIFLGSSFSFIPSMIAAFAGATSVALGYAGILLGALLAGLVYVILSAVVKVAGVEWISKLMPAAVIGPTVAIIGLGLSGSAVGQLQGAPAGGHTLIAVLCGLVTLFATMFAAVFGKKTPKLISFIIGILCGYAFAAVLTFIGMATGCDAIKVIDFSGLTNLFANGVTVESFVTVPDFTFIKAFGGFGEMSLSYFGTIALAYIPVGFVVFAEHLADHRNMSTIIEKDLLKDPGLDKTLLGDGVGSIAGAFFGGCPNTTYGESIACVAITGNASVVSIITAALLALLISFLSFFVGFFNTIPSCVWGGVCMALYGFIAVSGLKMIKNVDLDDNRNLFTVSVILVAGIGGLALDFGGIVITNVATALILGIIVNLVLGKKKNA
ncbi:MAG: uracil-xanthine permease [Lachnospiraceae bacterium]|nr:uracil-xanthine permease [Lachnospiraceae bacterium]